MDTTTKQPFRRSLLKTDKKTMLFSRSTGFNGIDKTLLFFGGLVMDSSHHIF